MKLFYLMAAGITVALLAYMVNFAYTAYIVAPLANVEYGLLDYALYAVLALALMFVLVKSIRRLVHLPT